MNAPEPRTFQTGGLEFRIHSFPEVTSTNTLAHEWAEKGAPEGTVLCADYQTAGRGKPGNRWISPRGKNLLFSLILRPRMDTARAPLLTQTACRAVAQSLRSLFALEPVFKRPNDVLVDGRKICGVLLESASSAKGGLQYVIMGIGLNVNAALGELPENSISLAEILKKDQDLDRLLLKILEDLAEGIRNVNGVAA